MRREALHKRQGQSQRPLHRQRKKPDEYGEG